VRIKARVPASVIEYPGHIADVLYVGGCNFRCPYCYNVDLVLRPDCLQDLPTEQLLEELRQRLGFVDGIVVSGGEPTLQPHLRSFLQELRSLGYRVKLDTNGYRPDVLEACLEEGLVDYVAMDVKTSLSKYPRAAGVPIDLQRVVRSVELLLAADADHEFRTTVVPDIVSRHDIEEIGELICGARHYYLQSFRPGPTVGWGECPPVGAPQLRLLSEMSALASKWVSEVGIRGSSSVVE